MNARRAVLIVAASLLAVGAAAGRVQEKLNGPETPVLALTGGTLIDGRGGAPVPDAVVLVQGRRILAAGASSAVKVPVKAERIDVRGKFILPGLIDCHIHLTWPFDSQQSFTDTDASTALRGLFLMNRYLRSGVTSVRDVGSIVSAMQALAGAREAGFIDSIRLFACGNVITVTGGHGDGYKGTLTADGPWEWRRAVRKMHQAGFRQIKISPTFTPEEAAAAVDEAKTLGMRVTAHGGGVSDTTPTTMTRIAVEAGVHCIEHLPEMEDGVLDLMARRGVFSVPTLTVYRDQYRAGMLPPTLQKRNWSWAMHETLFRKARERGILMGIGTDYVIDMKAYPGCYFEEMRLFIELGVSPMDAIIAATRNGAVILGCADELGTIEPGKLADLQVIGADPLKSFDSLGKPEIVMIDGRIHRF